MTKNVMLDYIYETPRRLCELLTNYQIEDLMNNLKVQDIRRIIFVASGSSFNIGLIAKRTFEKYANVSVENYVPYDFLTSTVEKYNKNGTLVIAISQTGTSTGTLNCIKYAKLHNLKVLTITEQMNTEVSTLGDYYLNFLCGFEDSNAKTKGYTNSLALLYLLALNISKMKGIISTDTLNNILDEFNQVTDLIPETINRTLDFINANKSWATINHLLVIGHGTNYGTAIEGMLKIVETLCIPGSVIDIGEFSHGFHRAVSCNSNIILINTEGYGKEITEATIEYLKNKVNKLLVIDASKSHMINDYTINIDYLRYTESSLLIAIVFQVLAAYLPEVIGYDPNRNSNNDYSELVKARL